MASTTNSALDIHLKQEDQVLFFEEDGKTYLYVIDLDEAKIILKLPKDEQQERLKPSVSMWFLIRQMESQANTT